LETVESIKKPE